MPEDAGERQGYLSVLKGFVAIVAVFALVFLILFAYSGLWPPIVVVESNSMQHSDTSSSIGVIDTGDIVIVRKVDCSGDVVTYVEGLPTRHRTYGEYGDVVIYDRYGQTDGTPIIHRAICRIVYNETGGGFDIPSLALIPDDQWEIRGASEKTVWNLTGVVEIREVGYLGVTVELDLNGLLIYFETRGLQPHGGLITMGDHNVYTKGSTLLGYYDQLSICREPIKDEWLVGKARGEIPWFGLLKLWVTGGAPSNVPGNSVTNLWLSIALIIGLPIALDLANVLLKRRGIEIFGWTERLSLSRLRGKGEKEVEAAKEEAKDGSGGSEDEQEERRQET